MKPEIYSIVLMTPGGRRAYEFETLFTSRNENEIESLKRDFGFKRKGYVQNSRAIIVVTQGGQLAPGRFDFETVFTSRDEDEIESLKQELRERHMGFRREGYVRNSRAVVVVDVNKTLHREAQTIPGRNRLVSKPVKKGQRFRSANEASGHLGLTHNEVSMYLANATRAGQKTTTLRGVTFAYEDEQ